MVREIMTQPPTNAGNLKLRYHILFRVGEPNSVGKRFF